MIKRPIIFIILIVALVLLQFAVCHYFPDKVEAAKNYRFDVQHKETDKDGFTYKIVYDIQTRQYYLIVSSGHRSIGITPLKGVK